MDQDLRRAHAETRRAWNSNAAGWDARMADAGNDFVNLLCWPALQRLLAVRPGQHVLDAACGNGILSRRLAALGAEVTAFDFSAALIDLARARTHPSGAITYQLLDATRPDQLRRLAKRVGPFDSLLCSMALFDISDIQPLFQAPPLLLRPGGAFVFSLGHPAFNHSSAARMVEQLDEGGQVRMLYSIKVSRYIPPYLAHGVALRGQSRPQVYFERPLQDYLILGFENGCVLDGFEERAFPPGHPQRDPLDWGGNFSEFPAVVVLRLRLKGS